MKLQNIYLVLALIEANPHIPPEKFFRLNGCNINYVPRSNKLTDEHITAAVGVLHNTPIFIGDRFWYNSSNYCTYVVLDEANVSAEGTSLVGEYLFSTIESKDTCVVTYGLLNKFLSLNRPKPVYETVLFNGISIRKPVLMHDELHTIRIEDGTGKEYWVDSEETAKNLTHFIQSVVDDIIYQATEGNNIRVIVGSNKIAEVRKINT